MGLDPISIALIATAASAGVSAYNTHETEKKQDNALVAQLQQQKVRQGEADQATKALIDKDQASNPKDAQQKAAAQYDTQLANNQAVAAASVPTTPGASSTYKDDAKNAALGIGDYGTKMAGLMSRIDAPQAQRQQEAFNAGDTSAKLGQISNFAQGDNFLSQLRLNAIRRNAGLDALASVLKGVGSAAGGMGGGGSSGYGIDGGVSINGAGNASDYAGYA